MSARSCSVGVLVLAAFACAKPAPPGHPELAARFRALLDSGYAAASPGVPALSLVVDAPALGVAFAGSAGFFDPATGERLTPEHTLRIASNTKTYVAAAVLRLVETGRVGVDSAIERYLRPESVRALTRGGYRPDSITVRQLLTHTSGIVDYAMSPTFAAAVAANFGRRWTREEQLAIAVDSLEPVGRPGERFHYSDTGYILLGELIERVTGQPMGRAIRELVGFDRLGIRHTYFESLDSVPPGTPPRAHQYLDSTDAYGLDPSHDLYGGGGIVASLADLARFYRALVRGEVFEKRETLDLMLTVTPASEAARPGGYGMGIGRSTVAGVTCWGHSGYWGTTARHCPSIDLTVVAAMNRSPDSVNAMGRLATAALEAAIAAGGAER